MTMSRMHAATWIGLPVAALLVGGAGLTLASGGGHRASAALVSVASSAPSATPVPSPPVGCSGPTPVPSGPRSTSMPVPVGPGSTSTPVPVPSSSGPCPCCDDRAPDRVCQAGQPS
jgi:hypothetical protein